MKNRVRRAAAWMAVACVAGAPVVGWAVPADPLIEGARMCTQYFPAQERANNIPTHLLAAISTTESGRWHDGLGMSVPWPWTINVAGKGYYFGSKAEAIAQTAKLMRAGHESIDVGCMQVNLKHHAKAFANLDQAFDPKTNVAYAAKFLHDNYAEMGDWIKATAAYHSRTPVHGNRYLGEIEKSWNRIVAKVAQARNAAGVMSPGTGGQQVAMAAPVQPASSKMRPIKETHNVKIIRVSDAVAPVKRDEVLVIHATPAPAAVKLADAAPVASVTPASDLLIKGDSVRKVRLDAPAPTGGTKFVFAN